MSSLWRTATCPSASARPIKKRTELLRYPPTLWEHLAFRQVRHPDTDKTARKTRSIAAGIEPAPVRPLDFASDGVFATGQIVGEMRMKALHPRAS